MVNCVSNTYLYLDITGPEADAIVRGAGYDPSSVSLSSVFDHCNGEVSLLHGNNITVRAVSTQYCGTVSVILVQYTSPAVVLDSIGIEKMHSALAGKIIVCSESVPSSCLAAFSEAGVLAVICPEEENANSQMLITDAAGTASSLNAFWNRFYSELQRGSDLIMALRRAEESEPALDGAFKIHS